MHIRKTACFFFVLLYFFCYLCSPQLLADTTKKDRSKQVTNEKIKEYHLKNGLSVIIKPDHRAPLVLSQIWYRVGGCDEPTGLTGISHVLEHMMFKGTKQFPHDSVFQQIAAAGGIQNAETSEDYTMYYQEISRDKLPLLFQIEADRMQHLQLSKKDFEKELKVVQEERKMRVDNDPIMLAYERYNAIGYNNNPYRQPVVGWASDLAQLRLADVQSWYKHWYHPNNATLIVIGDVEPALVLRLVERSFGAIPAQRLPDRKNFPNLKPIAQRDIAMHLPAKLPVLYLGYNVDSAATAKDERTAYALDVLATALGGQDSARLQKILVREKSLAGDIGISYRVYARLPTRFDIIAIPAQGVRLKQLEKAILEQVTALQKKPLSAAELEKVKMQVIADRIYRRDSITSEATLMGNLLMAGLPVTEINHYETEVNTITPEEVTAVAKRYLTEKNLTVGMLYPEHLEVKHF